jgi:hypothetical protein
MKDLYCEQRVLAVWKTEGSVEDLHQVCLFETRQGNLKNKFRAEQATSLVKVHP